MTNKRHVAVCLAAMISGSATAGTLDVDTSGGAPIAPSADQHLWQAPAVKNKGEGYAEPITSSGQGVALSDAAKMIVPQSWSVFASNQVSPDTKVSWHADKEAWTTVLGRSLDGSGVQALIDWSGHAVYFSPSQVARTAPKKAKPTVAASGPSIVDSLVQHKASDYKPPVWQIAAGVPISSSVEKWGETSHWKVIWSAQSWAPTSAASLSGDFNQAITDLVLAANNQGFHIRADFYNNRVVVISGTDQ